MNTDYETEAVKELAEEIKEAGFRVFIAKRGTYGVYTDIKGSRVVSFQYDLGGMKFYGNYNTSSPKRTGTGWQLGGGDFKTMFEQAPPSWAIHGASWQYTTLDQHLTTYQRSSEYAEV